MDISRRTLLTGAAALAVPTSSFAGVFQDRPTIKVGLIGCGGRGSGAIRDNLAAEEGAVVYAMADLFEDRVKGCLEGLKKDLPKRVNVGDRTFFGLDAYQKLLASGVDVVILATPPGFRPGHIRAVINAGKHLFTEKPVAVDGPGIRDVIESAKLAKEKNLTIVAGTQRRADLAYMECMKRVHDGDIGDILSMNCYWNQGGLWMVPRKDGMTGVNMRRGRRCRLGLSLSILRPSAQVASRRKTTSVRPASRAEKSAISGAVVVVRFVAACPG